MPLRRPTVAAALVLALAACGDPEGPTVTVPDRGIEGAWLRVHDPNIPFQSLTGLPAYSDTLRFSRLGDRIVGVWLQRVTTPGADGLPEALRACSYIRLATDRPRLLLDVDATAASTSGTCPTVAFDAPAADRVPVPGDVRPLSQVSTVTFEALREGRDLLRLRPLTGDPELRAARTEWYQRIRPPAGPFAFH